MTKDKIRQTIDLVRELNSSLTISYIPSSKIDDADGAYQLKIFGT